MAARLLGAWCLVAAQGDDEAWARAATLATAPRSDELVLERSCQGLGHGPVGLGNVVRRVPRYLRAAAARNSSLAFVAVDAFAELCEAFDCRGRLRRRGAGPSHDCAADRFAAYATAGERGRFDAAHDAELRAVLGGPNAAVMGRLRRLWRGPPATFEALVAAGPRPPRLFDAVVHARTFARDLRGRKTKSPRAVAAYVDARAAATSALASAALAALGARTALLLADDATLVERLRRDLGRTYDVASFDAGLARAHSGRDRGAALADGALLTYVEWWAAACASAALGVTWLSDARGQGFRKLNANGAEVSSFLSSARAGAPENGTYYASLLPDGSAVLGRPWDAPSAARPASGAPVPALAWRL